MHVPMNPEIPDHGPCLQSEEYLKERIAELEQNLREAVRQHHEIRDSLKAEVQRLREALETVETFLMGQTLTGRLGANMKVAKFAELSAKGEHRAALDLLDKRKTEQPNAQEGKTS